MDFVKKPLGFGLLIGIPAAIIIGMELKNIATSAKDMRKKGRNKRAYTKPVAVKASSGRCVPNQARSEAMALKTSPAKAHGKQAYSKRAGLKGTQAKGRTRQASKKGVQKG